MTDTASSDDVVRHCGELARLAAASDSPQDLVVAAAQALSRPLVLLNADGAPLVISSPTIHPETSVDALIASAANGGMTPGWHVQPISRDGQRLALLAMGGDPQDTQVRILLDLVVSLLSGQFARAALTSTIRDERRIALLRRLVTDESITGSDLRAEAQAAGVPLADYYWPALLVWTAGCPVPHALAELRNTARRVPETIVVMVSNTTLTLLFPARCPGQPSRETVHKELGELACAARRLGCRDARAIADECCVKATHVPSRVGKLQRLRRYMAHTASEPLVRRARSFALNCLLNDKLDREHALDFVRGRLCRLLRYDLDHGTDLARVLELALDFPRRDDAAHAGYMHRNTFRRHLARALELVDTDLHDPDDRLTLHVALKLHRMLQAPVGTTGNGERSSKQPG